MLFKDEKLKPLNILLYLIGVTTIILIMQHFYKLMPDFKYELPIEFLVITVVSCFFLYLISGNKTFKSAFNDTGYVIKTLFPTLLFPLLFCVMGILTIVMDKPALKDTWLFDTIMNLFCMMLVGIYEEVGFRFCACDAMLPVLKKTKHLLDIFYCRDHLWLGSCGMGEFCEFAGGNAVCSENCQSDIAFSDLYVPVLEDQKYCRARNCTLLK